MKTRTATFILIALFLVFSSGVYAQDGPPEAIDVDGDGTNDFYDVDGDGEADEDFPIAYDMDGDGEIDMYDITGDGTPDVDTEGNAPMELTDPNGEPLSDQFQVVDDGVDEKFRIAEDATDVSITEHSVAYNTGAIGAESGAADAQWTLTDAEGNTMDAGSGTTEYSGVIQTPGHYNLGNSGMTPVDESAVDFGGAVNSGTDVELEVTDITAPSLKLVAVPEDYHERNFVLIEEDPDNPDAYPITNKTAKITMQGRNWSMASAADGSASPVENEFSTDFGMVDEDDAAKVADSRENPDVKAKNVYTIDSSLDSSVEDGFYVPVAVRTNFEVGIVDDNDPRDAYRDREEKTWRLEVEHNGSTEVFREPPSFVFRIPNVPADSDSPKYTLVGEAIDGSGNSIVCKVPINVLPKKIDVTDLERMNRKQ